MLTCNRLRIESENNSAAVEYRIEDDFVEYRSLPSGDERGSNPLGEWRRLDPEELGGRVLSSPILAYWLRRKIGLYGLIRACNRQEEDSSFASATECSSYQRASTGNLAAVSAR